MAARSWSAGGHGRRYHRSVHAAASGRTSRKSHTCVEAADCGFAGGGPRRHVALSGCLRAAVTRATAGDVAAVLQAQAKTFDLLISDLGLPDGSSIDLLNSCASGDYPAIAMTGFGREDIARTRAAGFTAHLVKPIDLEQMTRTIAEAAGPAQQP